MNYDQKNLSTYVVEHHFSLQDTNGASSLKFSAYRGDLYLYKVIVEYIGEDTPDDGTTTIAKLLSGAKDVEAAKIKLTNAQVVYKEDNAGSYNYIVREDGKAIDLMNTSLSLDLGATLNGTVVMNVAYNGGIMRTTDITETNSSDLTPTGSSIDYLPITTTLDKLSNNKGDLVRLEKVEVYDDTNGDLGLGSVHLLKSGYTYVLISNYDEIADQITDANGKYFVTAWYNGAQGAIASVKVVAVQQALAAPVITAAEPSFTESTKVTITAADGASIYYTTDGTTPTVGGATTQVYTVPFTIYKTTTVKAIAVKDGVSSDVSENTFHAPLTIAELYAAGSEASQSGAVIQFTDAKVVYADGQKNFIVRENGKALDVLNSDLDLHQGDVLNGLVTLNVVYSYGILSTSDVSGVTNADKLRITSGENTDSDPIVCANFTEVLNHPGDLVTLDNLTFSSYFFRDGNYGQLNLSNYSEFGLVNDVSYDAILWYNEFRYGYYAYAKIVKADKHISELVAPIITGEEKFVGSTTLAITHPEAVATIQYTMDGTDPLNTTSTVYTYTEPLTLSESATVCAVATYKNVKSPLATKTFTKIDFTVPKTVAELAELQMNVSVATVKFVNAQVVYADDTNFILREEDGKAIDLLATGLALEQGKTVTGTVKLEIGYYNGILSAYDVEGETNAAGLTFGGTVSEDPIPVIATAFTVNKYPGDLVKLEDKYVYYDSYAGEYYVNDWGYDENDQWVGRYIYFSNCEEKGVVGDKQYNITFWYNSFKGTDPLALVVKAERTTSSLSQPSISGNEVFQGSQEVTISCYGNDDIVTIYYTTDDTDPTTSSTAREYDGPVTLTASATVKAYAVFKEIKSEVASKTFTCVSADDPMTIAEIADLRTSLKTATVRFVDAKVVYGEKAETGYNYIIRDYDGETPYAIDLLSTSLPLTVGDKVTGTVKFQITYVDYYQGGVLKTADVAETPDHQLAITQGENTLPSPLNVQLYQVTEHPGDLVTVQDAKGDTWANGTSTTYVLWNDTPQWIYLYPTNGEEYEITKDVTYDAMLWYTGPDEDGLCRVKIIGLKDNYEYLMTAAGWGAIIIPFDCEKPEGLTIYECTSVNDGKLVAEEVNCFKANTPYLLKGTKGEETTYPLEGYAAKHEDKYEKGVMVGVYSWQEPPADSYVLQDQDAGLAFYRHLAGNGVEVGPNRCYIKPQSGELKSIQFPDDETNGVANANATDSTLVDVYTTAGVKVEHQVEMGKALNDLPAGLYIINNKKIVKK